MCAWEFRAGPFVCQLPRIVIEENVVGCVVCQEHDVVVCRAGKAVAIVDWGVSIERTPAGDDAILEVALAEHLGRGRLREGTPNRPMPRSGDQSVLQERAAAESFKRHVTFWKQGVRLRGKAEVEEAFELL